MDVLVVRHAIALDKADAIAQGVPDADRPLTKDGRRRMKRIARGLARSVPDVSLLFSSPWRRAVETADLLRARFKDLPNVKADALLPEAEPDALARLLAGAAASSIAVVGHEPHLSRWVSWCLADSRLADSGLADSGLADSGLADSGLANSGTSIVELGKGGACLLRFEGAAGPGRGKLLWLMTPALLRQL